MKAVILPKDKDDTVQLRSGVDFRSLDTGFHVPDQWTQDELKAMDYNRSRVNDILGGLR